MSATASLSGSRGFPPPSGLIADTWAAIVDLARSSFHRAAMNFPVSLAAALIAMSSLAGQSAPQSEAERAVADIRASHVAANVPDKGAFATLLERDLKTYFAGSGVKNPSVSFELLRQGPTQSGIAYPKFYLWVEVKTGGNTVLSGAVRVAAIEKTRFEVTDFLRRQDILSDPERVAEIFPAALVEVIRARAATSASGRP